MRGKKVGLLFYSTGRGPKGSNAINLTQLVFRVWQCLKMSSFFSEVKRFLKKVNPPCKILFSCHLHIERILVIFIIFQYQFHVVSILKDSLILGAGRTQFFRVSSMLWFGNFEYRTSRVSVNILIRVSSIELRVSSITSSNWKMGKFVLVTFISVKTKEIIVGERGERYFGPYLNAK